MEYSDIVKYFECRCVNIVKNDRQTFWIENYRTGKIELGRYRAAVEDEYGDCEYLDNLYDQTR